MERFSSGGRVLGAIGIVGVAAVLAYGALDRRAGFEPWAYPLCLLVGVAIWTTLVRPGLLMDASTLELRNLLHSRWIPLARITDVSVGQVAVVHADGRRYVGTGVGRTRRQIRQDARRPDDRPEERSYGLLVEHRIRRRAEDARAVAGGEPPVVRRTWAWPEIGALGLLTIATVALWLA